MDCVLNYDLPTHSKDYIHRVGRTARAGKSGKAISFVSQYDVELYQRIEQLIGKKLPKYGVEDEDVMIFQERVREAQIQAKRKLKENEDKMKGNRKRKKGDVASEDFDDHGEKAKGYRNRVKQGQGHPAGNKKFNKKFKR